MSVDTDVAGKFGAGMRLLLSSLVLTTLAQVSQAVTFKICYVSSPVGPILPRMSDLPKQYAGFKQAVEEFNRTSGLSATFMPAPIVSGDNNPVLNGVHWADKEGCHALVGLVSSRDALLAGPELKSRGLVGISSTATANDLDRWYPNVLSASTSVKSYVEALARHMNESPKDRVIAISRSNDIYSLAFTEEISRKLASRVEIWNLKHDNELSPENLGTLTVGKPTSILYTTYPILSMPSLSQIAMISRGYSRTEWRVFGTQSWMEIQAFRARTDLIALLPPIFLFNPWEMRTKVPGYAEFRARFTRMWGTTPDHDTIYDYDTAKILLRCFENNPKTKTPRKAILDCVSKRFEHTGMTGRYEFDGLHAHPQRPENLIPYNVNGMIPEA